MQDAKVRYALLAICLVCLLGSGGVLLTGHRPAPPPVSITPPPTDGKDGDTEAAPTTSAPEPARARAQTSAAASPHPTRVYVDVGGEVRRPSLYVLPADGRVMQALVAAGGPTQEADLNAVNLAQKVTDGEKIFVPRRGAAPSALPSPTPTAAPARAVSDTPPGPSAPDAAPAPARTARGGKGGHTGHADKISADTGEQIALNSATLEQLERLPGVGPSMAGRILAYRQQAGSFTRVEDLRLVQGIGPKKFAKIAPCVKLE
jgi:competence protein ComEA